MDTEDNTTKNSEQQRSGGDEDSRSVDGRNTRVSKEDKNDQKGGVTFCEYADEEESETEKEKNSKMKNSDDDKEEDELSMFEDEDDDDVDGGLYGQQRHRNDFSTGAPPGSFEMYALNRRELEERRIRHHELVRKILAEFDIEEVMERHRGKGVILDMSHANRKFRMWLERVMGDDNIQLSDRKWHELLRQKVMEDYDHKLKERERQLAEAEVQRIQRLRLQGILTSDDVAETIAGHGHTRSKKKSHRKSGEQSTRQQDLYAKPTDDIQTQMSIINITSDNSQEDRTSGSPGDNEEEDDENKKDGGKDAKAEKSKTKTGGAKIKEPEPDNKGIDDEEEATNDKENDNTSSKDNHSNNGHIGMCGSVGLNRNPNVQCLYKEEDLRQLYAHAETLVRPGVSSSRKH